MVTEEIRTPRTYTDEEWQQEREKNDEHQKAIEDALTAGIGARTLTIAEQRGLEMLVDYVFDTGSSEDYEQWFGGRGAMWAQRLAAECAGDRLLTKFLGVWYLEGNASDWKDLPDGILGKALDQAADMLRPYAAAAIGTNLD